MKHFLLFGFISFVLITSCVPRDTKDFTFGQDSALALTVFQDIFIQIDQQAQQEASLKACPAINLVTNNGDFPKRMSIEFGDSCTGTDDRIRIGSIHAEFSGLWRQANTQVLVELDSYFVAGYLLQGDVNISHTGLNNRGNPSYAFELKDGRMVHPNGEVTQWEGNFTVEWESGQSTNFNTEGINGIIDDVYRISGNGNGIHRAGRAFDFSITQPLKLSYSCNWLSAGEVEIQPANGAAQRLDMGAEDCDKQIMIDLKRALYTFLLP